MTCAGSRIGKRQNVILSTGGTMRDWSSIHGKRPESQHRHEYVENPGRKSKHGLFLHTS